MPAESLFEMQIANAARAVGLADRIGCLEVGKRADLMIRTDALADAQPGLNSVQEMVLIGRTKTVDTVIVDGKWPSRAACRHGSTRGPCTRRRAHPPGG